MIFPLPEIDKKKPIYICGAGLMGVSYVRQMKQKGILNLIEGFIEEGCSKTEYLGFPVIELNSLSKEKISATQFIIASKRYQDEISNNLIKQGCLEDNIRYPSEYMWSRKIQFDMELFKKRSRFFVYKVIDNYKALCLIYKRVVRHLSMLEANSGCIIPTVTLIVSYELEFNPYDFDKAEIVRADLSGSYPEKQVKISDIVFIFDSEKYKKIDFNDRYKIYFYGLGLVQKFKEKCNYSLIKRISIKHIEWVEKLKIKDKIRVVFLAIHASVWKVDTVFRRMLEDPYFEPEILVCPYIPYGEERMLAEMNQAYSCFKRKGYPVKRSLKHDGTWLKLEEVQPDVIFFTNPHNITRHEYYGNAYVNYLTCYIPYFFLTTTHDDDKSIYNNLLHSAVWKIFMPHEYSMLRTFEVSSIKGVNCLLTGYPSCEDLIDNKIIDGSAWKDCGLNKKKIIFAPHHTIFESSLKLSNFLSVSEIMVDMAKKYSNDIQWSFKPHPILKSKLFLHPLWGKEKTNKYYSFWEEQEYTQLDEGEYTKLFIESDAIIHDCGSFIAEYLFVNKPCAYLEINGESQLESINDFGKKALEAYFKVKNKNDLEFFIDRVVSGKAVLNKSHLSFLKNYIEPMYKENIPSVKILKILKKSLGRGV